MPWSSDKSVTRQTKATRLGVVIDGEHGSLGVSVEKRLTLFQLGVFLLCQQKVSKRPFKSSLANSHTRCSFGAQCFLSPSTFVEESLRPTDGWPIFGGAQRNFHGDGDAASAANKPTCSYFRLGDSLRCLGIWWGSVCWRARHSHRTTCASAGALSSS